ncbi:ethanolamine ammonia-lyase subunit EutC [Hyphomicrobium sp.]|uniref:ethanolamine ammonia-lyase subunit EutC n=1 Tax=Hyphomicrobium sp. TaxID=82 RepID=UPI001D973946|nr:ethanolamine ammonia-lyase subunit EutC [Hyphomicrobium sp.]MBY0558860.1 ethanolamine ammonia-lyase subunit EutC [Hyphomicrobium sp.]
MADISRKDAWTLLKSATSARIGLGRSGDAMPLDAVLDFQHAHARARDAVHAKVDFDAISAALETPTLHTLHISSATQDRATYLRRPDLGRILHADSEAALKDAVHAADIILVVADGLSAAAVQAHSVPLLKALVPRLTDFVIGPVLLATRGRVALGDHIGEILQPKLIAMLIGERPGLSVAESLGVYLTYAPRLGRQDSERNCISNIHGKGGLGYEDAAGKIAWLTREALRRSLTGIHLKEDASAQLSAAPGNDSALLSSETPEIDEHDERLKQ